MGAFDFLFGGQQQMPGTAPGSYGLVDPNGYSAGSYSNLSDTTNWLKNQMAGYGSQAGNLTNFATSGGASQNGWFNQFLNNAGNLNGTLAGPMSDLYNQTSQNVQNLVQQSTNGVANQFANMGSVYSGGAQSTANKAAANIGGQYGAQLAGQQLNLSGTAMNQYMNQLQGGALTGAQNYGNLYQAGAYPLGFTSSALGQFGSPTYAAPQYQQTSGLLGGLLPAAGTIGGFMLGGPMGAAMGSQLGSGLATGLRGV